jgi:hypothetical protein
MFPKTPAAALRRAAPPLWIGLLACAAPSAAETTGAPDAEVTSAAPAEGGSSSRSKVYQPGFFAAYSPTTALDMVRQVPGFAIEEADGEVRGFSGAAGNVVFNGARASSKSEALTAQLARIPARRVLRIEVAPGDVFGSDFAGRSQVLNVITTKAGGIDGNIKASVTRLHSGRATPNLEGAVVIRSGKSTFNLSAESGRNIQSEIGFDELRRASDAVLLERRDKRNEITNHQPAFAASWAHDDGANKSAHLNLRYAPGSFNLAQYNHVTPASGPQRDDRLTQDYKPKRYEIGGDVTRPLGGGALKFVVLANRRERDDFDAYYTRLNDAVVGGFEQNTTSRYDEVLGRVSWTHPKVAGFALELGTELAYNKLDNATDLFLLGPGGARDPIDLPIDRATVDELRSESYVNLGRQLTPTLRLDTTLAFEVSKLTVSGDTSAERSLRFFKPGVTLDWKGADGWHVQASMRRQVAQLNFYDFISAAELANDRVNGGNANLRPQRTWEARLTVERPVLGKGQVRLEAGYDWASDLQDRILTPEGFDAPGNIGSGMRKFVQGTFDAPLDQLGLKGTRFKLTGGWQEHSVRDPLTGQERPWSGFRPAWNWSAELRRDAAKWSYGLSVFRQATSTVYRIDEIDRFFNSGPFGIAFAEYRPDKKTTIRLDVENVFDVAGQRERTFFDPDRRQALASAVEFRHRDAHAAVTLSVNRTFGAG